MLIVALADGAGSAAYADLGATVTCDALIRSVLVRLNGSNVSEFTRGVITDVLNEARRALTLESARRGIPLRELACTVLVAVVDRDAAAFAQLGDGAFVIAREDRFEPVVWPQEGEYANTTNFLTDEDFVDSVEIVFFKEPILEFAAFTDGLQRLALDYANRTGHAGFFRPLFQRLKSAATVEELLPPFRQFLDSPRINDRTDDDKTLVLATRLKPDEPATETR